MSTSTQTKISFEYFPPKTLEGSFRLWETATRLAPFATDFISVTYGAGGSTRELTGQTVRALRKATDLNVAAHLTCVGDTCADTLEVAEGFARDGVTDIVALRGDQPGGGAFTPVEGGFTSSVDLIEALAARGKFRLHVGAYPDGHPDEADLARNVDWLKRKIDAGADDAITQFFFEADSFLRFRDAATRAGITAPIIPGILPVDNWAGTVKFAKGCGTPIPDWASAGFEQAIAEDRARRYAHDLATDLCAKLLAEGVGHFHFYTLNKADLVRDVILSLDIAPPKALRQVA